MSSPDDVFATLATRAGGIEPLLDQFFGFLNRRTDFYVQFPSPSHDVTSPPKYRMGFPAGIAQQMVDRAFHKYPMKDYYEVTGERPPQSSNMTKPIPPTPTITPESSSTKVNPATDSTPASVPLPAPNPSQTAPAVVSTPSTKPISTSTSTVRITETDAQIPIGNGGVTPRYTWTQSLHEVSVYISLTQELLSSLGHTPQSLKSRDLAIDITPRHIRVTIKGKGEPMKLIDDELPEVIRVSESMWTMAREDQCSELLLYLVFHKTRETWWSCVFEGDPKIDTTKVDSTRQISDYDELTQATIRKLMAEHRQKRLEETLSPQQQMENLYNTMNKTTL